MAEITEYESKKSEKTLVSIIENKKNEGFMSLCKILEKFGWKWNPETSSSSTTQTEEVSVQTTKKIAAGGGEIVPEKPDVVTFPDAVASRHPDFSSLKLKFEEPEKGGSHMWPVYALGGFMIAKWMWARWMEAKAKKPDNPPSRDEEPNQGDD